MRTSTIVAADLVYKEYVIYRALMDCYDHVLDDVPERNWNRNGSALSLQEIRASNAMEMNQIGQE